MPVACRIYVGNKRETPAGKRYTVKDFSPRKKANRSLSLAPHRVGGEGTSRIAVHTSG